ncbi:hypothetical protein [Cohnella silvisoli]|uniref:Uncharacterized protein n=1 Tax=Cohnella silvisoli TaxID=2873699 RepID=A0ABV1L1P8_9BACL|nr:hypothetical protein [Cohnella silvisoli]MCD9025289.1 hypothetical protein [Cohnella silvisoli]
MVRKQWNRLGVCFLSLAILLGSIIVLPQAQAEASTNTVKAQVLNTYLFTSNATYNGNVAKYVYSDGTTVKESDTVPTSAKWVTASSIYDGGWGRYSREAFYRYSDGTTISEVANPLDIPVNAKWATIYKYKVIGVPDDPFIGGQVYLYSLDGEHVLSGSSIPAYAIWGTLAGSTDGFSFHSHSETFKSYDTGIVVPSVTGSTIKSNDTLSVSIAKPSDTITVDLAIDGPVDRVVATIAGRIGTVEKLDNTHRKATLLLDGTEAEGDIPLLVEIYTIDGFRLTATATTDGSKVLYDKTGPSIETSYDPDWMTNQDVTITVDVTDPGSG